MLFRGVNSLFHLVSYVGLGHSVRSCCRLCLQLSGTMQYHRQTGLQNRGFYLENNLCKQGRGYVPVNMSMNDLNNRPQTKPRICPERYQNLQVLSPIRLHQ